MPFDNVVLQYAHPHVAVFVEDNTTYTETFLSADEPVTLLQCGVFASGRDNQLLYCETYDEFVNEFGTPNYNLYGQAGYNIVNALKTEYAAAYVMRVMPDDATYSNLVANVKYWIEPKEEVDDIAGTTSNYNVLHIEYHLSTLDPSPTTDLEFEEAINSLRSYDVDEDGSYTNPLFCIRQAGRGKYGNATRIRFADVTAYDDPDNNYKSYRLDVLEMSSSLNRVEYCYGSFNPDLYDTTSKESLYLEDLVNDPEEGMTKIRINVVDAVMNQLVNLYNENCLSSEVTTIDEEGNETTTQEVSAEPVTSSTLDVLFGKYMDGTTDPHLEITSILDDTEGVSLNGGNDGSLDIDAENRDDVITECLIKAYNGTYDKRIQSRYSTACDFMLDANFDDSVKKVMVSLALKREWDAMCYIDTGLISTVDDMLTWLENMKSYFGNNVIKECQHVKVRDVEYTGKTIPVTMTYFLASQIPTHFSTRGLNIPMVLENFRITQGVRGTFLPTIEPDEDDIKKEFYNLRANIYETVRYGVYQRAWAITTQEETSDRLDEFNEYILQLAVQIATDEIRSKIYKFGEAEDRARYKTLADQRLQYELGPLVRSVTVDFTMSATDERRNIMRIVLRIVYKTVVKRGIVEIYLDPRA